MLSRTIFASEHDMFRDSVRRFVEQQIAPFHRQWEREGIVPRQLWRKAGEQGLLCPDVPAEYGGAGAEWRYNVVVIEELARAGVSGPGSGFMVHSEMVAPYLLVHGGEAAKKRYLPEMTAGSMIGAIAMTEPGGGSDLRNLRTVARRDGDSYVINGQKIYISNGFNADIVVVAAKTDPAAGAQGVSLIAVETDQPGFRRGRLLEKIGLHAQDTAELFFDDVRAPIDNLIGREGAGFGILMEKLAQERLVQAIRSASAIEAILEWTIDYARDRAIFGKALAEFQNTRFQLAAARAEAAMLRAYVDRCIGAFFAGELSGVEAAQVKLVASTLHCRAADECLQLFGGYGYVLEFPIARAFVDARVAKIAGGTVEVMKEIIGRDIFPRHGG